MKVPSCRQCTRASGSQPITFDVRATLTSSGESPALKYTRKPPSLALTLRVNTDEHRKTRGEYRGGGGGGVSIVQPAAQFKIVRIDNSDAGASRKYGVSQSAPRGKTTYLALPV